MHEEFIHNYPPLSIPRYLFTQQNELEQCICPRFVPVSHELNLGSLVTQESKAVLLLPVLLLVVARSIGPCLCCLCLCRVSHVPKMTSCSVLLLPSLMEILSVWSCPCEYSGKHSSIVVVWEFVWWHVTYHCKFAINQWNSCITIDQTYDSIVSLCRERQNINK